MQLRELALDRNKIRQLDPLALRGLANLRELRLEEVRARVRVRGRVRVRVKVRFS